MVFYCGGSLEVCSFLSLGQFSSDTGPCPQYYSSLYVNNMASNSQGSGKRVCCMKTPFEGLTPIYFTLIRPQGDLLFVDVYTDLVVVEMER